VSGIVVVDQPGEASLREDHELSGGIGGLVRHADNRCQVDLDIADHMVHDKGSLHPRLPCTVRPAFES
jgi:hypothetical protein